MSIYVETVIRTSIDELWLHTQDPALHERWDLRFSEITYLPKESAGEPQRFRYLTRIGFGLAISGEGESTGSRDGSDGSHTSALTFSSADRRSLIAEGSGYWKYVPGPDGVRFLTWYDYRPRFGLPGKLIDRMVFRPLMGWATAWSFDRLRLWLELGIRPRIAMRYAATHAIARAALVFIVAYHSLVPKLLGPHRDELTMLGALGLSDAVAASAVVAIGVAELAFAALLLVFWQKRWPAVLALCFAVIATLTVAVASPSYLLAAFNPVTLNLAMASLAMIDIITSSVAPSARRCAGAPRTQTT